MKGISWFIARWETQEPRLIICKCGEIMHEPKKSAEDDYCAKG